MTLPPLPNFDDDVLLGKPGTFSQFWYNYFAKQRDYVATLPTSSTPPVVGSSTTYINVLDNGVVGDGTTDDGPAIRTLYNSIVALGGGTMYFPGGHTYLISTYVSLDSAIGVTLLGDGYSSKLKRGAAITAGRGWIDIAGTGANITFRGLLFDGDVTASTGLLYTDFGGDPMHALLTTNTTAWLHSGANRITFEWCNFEHTGGYAALLDADTADVSDVSFRDCWFRNNRPHLFGTTSGDINYGSWTGGIFYRGDCRTSTSKLFAVRGLSVIDCHWRRCTGNCLWGHSMGFDTHHKDFNFSHLTFEDCGLDCMLMGNVRDGNVGHNVGHRIGYITRTDSDTPDPRYLDNKYAVFMDASGYVENVNYGPCVVTSVNGDGFNLDGCRNCTITSPQVEIPASGTPEYTEDQIALYGLNQSGTLGGRGISMGNTSLNGAGYNLQIISPRIRGVGFAAILLAFAKNCKVSNPLIVHPASAAEPAIYLFSASGLGDEGLCYGNTIEGAMVDYTGARYCVEEGGAGWTGTAKNRVFDTQMIGTPAGEFLKDAASASFVGVRTNLYKLTEQVLPGVSATGESILTMDAATHSLKLSQNGAAYVGLAFLAGSDKQVQFNDGEINGASANFTYDKTLQQLTITGITATAGIVAATSFIQSAEGFFSNYGNFNTFHAANGGFLGKNINLTDYIAMATKATPTPITADNFSGNGIVHYDASSGTQFFRFRYGDGVTSSSLSDAYGWAAGWFASSTSYQAIQAPSGGFLGNSLSLGKYIGMASNSSLAPSSGDNWFTGGVGTGLLNFDASSGTSLFYFRNGTGASSFSDASLHAAGYYAASTSYQAIQAPSGGMLANSYSTGKYIGMASNSSLSPTSGDNWFTGGVGTGLINYDASSGTQFFFLRYGTGASTFADAYGHAAGFAATSTNFDSIQTAGGMHATNGYTSDQAVYLKTYALSTSLNTPGAGYGALAHNSGATYWYWNGSAWATVNLSTVGGSGTPAGSNTQVQYNNSGAFGAIANFTFNSGTSVLTATGGMVSAVFNASSTGTSITFQNSNTNFQVDGNGNISGAGSINMSGTSPYKVSGTTIVDSSRNATFVGLTFGAFSSLVQGSTTRIDSSGNATFVGLTFGGSSALVQGATTRISTSGAATFTDLTIGGSNSIIQGLTTRLNSSGGFIGVVFNATATGASITFQNNNGNFQVDGNGNLSMAGNLNLNGSYQMDGTDIINTSRQFVGAGALCGSAGIGAGAFNPWNGAGYDTGATGTAVLASITSITFRGGAVTGWS